MFFLQIGSAIVKKIFTYGNLMDASHLLSNVLKRPETRQLTQHIMQTSTTVGITDVIVSNIKSFLGTTMKARGTRKTLEQQTYRTVVAACAGDNLVSQKLLRKASEALGIHIRNVKRGVADRTALQEKKGSGFVQCSRKEYRNKMPDLVRLECVIHIPYYYFVVVVVVVGTIPYICNIYIFVTLTHTFDVYLSQGVVHTRRIPAQ